MVVFLLVGRGNESCGGIGKTRLTQSTFLPQRPVAIKMEKNAWLFRINFDVKMTINVPMASVRGEKLVSHNDKYWSRSKRSAFETSETLVAQLGITTVLPQVLVVSQAAGRGDILKMRGVKSKFGWF